MLLTGPITIAGGERLGQHAAQRRFVGPPLIPGSNAPSQMTGMWRNFGDPAALLARPRHRSLPGIPMSSTGDVGRHASSRVDGLVAVATRDDLHSSSARCHFMTL